MAQSGASPDPARQSDVAGRTGWKQDARSFANGGLMGGRQKHSDAAKASSTASVTLEDKVSFLSRPEAYRDHPPAVEVVETHMSWVFLTELFAHKLKKPVRHDFLDFRDIESRRHFCEEEVRLNRRLAPDIYIAAVPLALSPGGGLALDGQGEPVDWLVRMKRLPADRMLDRAILARAVEPPDIEGIVALLAQFYDAALPVALPPATYRRRIADAVADQRQVLLRQEFDLPRQLIEAITGRLRKLLTGEARLFDRRVRQGRIIEGHGDLRPEHVFLGPRPAIIDCLEFNRDFRILDWLDELSFLAMECEALGTPEVGEMVLRDVCGRLGDEPPAELVLFYKSFRAMLRAKLAILHLQDDAVRDPGAWRARAESYLRLAGTFVERLI